MASLIHPKRKTFSSKPLDTQPTSMRPFAINKTSPVNIYNASGSMGSYCVQKQVTDVASWQAVHLSSMLSWLPGTTQNYTALTHKLV